MDYALTHDSEVSLRLHRIALTSLVFTRGIIAVAWREEGCDDIFLLTPRRDPHGESQLEFNNPNVPWKYIAGPAFRIHDRLLVSGPVEGFAPVDTFEITLGHVRCLITETVSLNLPSTKVMAVLEKGHPVGKSIGRLILTGLHRIQTAKEGRANFDAVQQSPGDTL